METQAYELLIERTDRKEKKSYQLKVRISTSDENATVATALTQINADPDRTDTEGNPFSVIEWECSCLQKKCGACAMRINGKPSLACDSKLRDAKEHRLVIEPLKKFPVIADLIVDRSILYENLKTVRAWLKDDAKLTDERWDMAYDGSRCLQCGCCLEVCPNFYPGGTFIGMGGFVPTARLLSEMTQTEQKEIRKTYRKHIYNGCGKSLACRDICPAGLDIEELLIRSIAIAVWKRG